MSGTRALFIASQARRAGVVIAIATVTSLSRPCPPHRQALLTRQIPMTPCLSSTEERVPFAYLSCNGHTSDTLIWALWALLKLERLNEPPYPALAVEYGLEHSLRQVVGCSLGSKQRRIDTKSRDEICGDRFTQPALEQCRRGISTLLGVYNRGRLNRVN